MLYIHTHITNFKILSSSRHIYMNKFTKYINMISLKVKYFILTR